MDPKYLSAQDVLGCDLCETPALDMYCDICYINLCKACVGEHLSDVSKEHKVVPFEKRGSTVNLPKCGKHSTKTCELQCKHCDCPICTLCVSSGEHEQHKKEDIFKTLVSKKEILRKDLQELENSILPKYKEEAVSNIPCQKADQRKHSQALSTALKNYGEVLHTEINIAIQKMQSKIDDMDSKHMASLDNREGEVNNKIHELTQIILDLKRLLKSSDVCLITEYKSRNEEFRLLPAQVQNSLPTCSHPKVNREQLYQLFGSLSVLAKEDRAAIMECQGIENVAPPLPAKLNVSSPPPARPAVSFLSDRLAVSSPPDRPAVPFPLSRPENDVAPLQAKLTVSSPPARPAVSSRPDRLVVSSPPTRPSVSSRPDRPGVSSPSDESSPPDRLALSSPPARPAVSSPTDRLAVSSPTRPAVSSPPARPARPSRVFLEEPETLADIKTKYAGWSDVLHCVSCLSENEFWTCGTNKAIGLYNLQGELLETVQTISKNYPFDITVTKSGDLVYADDYDETINIMNNKRIRTLIRLRGWRTRGVYSSASGDLLVTLVNDNLKQTKVVRYSGSSEKQTIQWDDHGQPIYSCSEGILKSNTKYLSENRNLDICVADSNARAVVVVSADGKLRFRYTGPPYTTKKSFKPRGIATDSQGNILTADYENNCIHILDQNGHFVRYIDDLKTPWGISVDARDNIFVTSHINGNVKKIQYFK